ncbi:MAG: shikimate dehydrogenase [Bacteroidetes bacterium]|nr:MAG: shikimate dehydrogenase [Bacteroidota bacterium]
MRKFGLIGKSLGHSFSPSYFSTKFEKEGIIDASYSPFPLADISEIDVLLQSPEICGLNVTIPYKEAVIPYLYGLSQEAEKIGAVNTLAKVGNDWIGHNTDHVGFVRSIAPFLEPNDQKALILGTGGASKAIAYALDQKGIIYKHVSRTPTGDELPYEALSSIVPHVDMIINTTPLGTFPAITEHPPIDFHLLSEKHFVIDLIYNPTETALLKAAKQNGARILNGLSMLHEQAEESWRIWNE